MAPINIGSKHQDLLKAYLEVSKGDKPDWAAIATKAEYPTPKYARDQWTIVKNKLLATDNGKAIDLSDRQTALLKAAVEVMKGETDWDKVARVASFKTPKYARDQWTIVKAKLTGATPTKERKSSVPGPSRKRKAKDGQSEKGSSAGSIEDAPASKWKKTAREVKVKVEEKQAQQSDEDDGDNERASTTPVPTTAKKVPTERRETTDKKAKDAETEATSDAASAVHEQTEDDEPDVVNDVKPTIQELVDEQLNRELQAAADEGMASFEAGMYEVEEEDMALIF